MTYVPVTAGLFEGALKFSPHYMAADKYQFSESSLLNNLPSVILHASFPVHRLPLAVCYGKLGWRYWALVSTFTCGRKIEFPVTRVLGKVILLTSVAEMLFNIYLSVMKIWVPWKNR